MLRVLLLRVWILQLKKVVLSATIKSLDPTTKEGGIELGAEFALMRIYR
jgi:hypothetical protein